MKIYNDKVKERMEGVPDDKRSHIYDASIVLEFLVHTFMPTRFFLPEGFQPKPATLLGVASMRKASEGKSMPMKNLYDLYLLWLEDKNYTTRTESRYIFGIIVRNLRFYRNGWEFVVWRVGTAQIWHIGPLVLRSDVPNEIRTKYATKLEEKTTEAVTVEADPVTDPSAEEELDASIEELVKENVKHADEPAPEIPEGTQPFPEEQQDQEGY